MATLIKKLLQGLKSFLKKIHHAIPPEVRNVYMPVAAKCLYFFQSHLNAFFPMVVLYEGLERQSGKPLSFVYAGDIHQMQNYWDHVILGDGFRKRPLGRRFFGKIVAQIRKAFPDCGFVIMEQSSLTIPFLKKNPGFSIPFWVRTEIDIREPMSKLFGQQRSDKERRIRKNKLSYEMTKDPKHFHDFYYNMHVPYVKDRYTDAAGVDSYESLLKAIPISEILLIKKEDKTIAGALVEFRDGKAMLRKLGIVDANMEYVRFGAIGAIYYFMVQELKKRGYNVMDIGGARPLLNDGLTHYKISLEARLCKENELHSCVRFMVLRNSEGARSFLTHNPFLFKNRRKKLCSAVFVENNGQLSSKALNDMITSSYCEGAAEIRIYAFGDQNAMEAPSLCAHQPVSIQSAEELING